MQRKQNSYCFLWLILPLLLISAVSAQTRNVRVGFYNNAPLSFVDENGLPAGFVVDVLQYVAEEENWELEYVHCEWNDCLQALEKGEIDLLAPIAYSDERAEIYDFTAETLITNWGQVYVHSGETDISILDLDEKIIAVIEEDTHTKFLQKRLLHFGFTVEFIFVDSYDEVMQAVDSGQAFGGIVNHLYALQNVANYDVVQSAIVFNPIEVRFAATKGEHLEILATFDEQLAALKADTNSLYYQSLNSWFDSFGGETIPLWARWMAAFLIFVIIVLVFGSIYLRAQVRKRTANLQETEAKYRELVNNSLVGVQINQNKVLQFCNQGLADIHGYENPEEMIGMSLEALVTPESWLKVKTEIDARESGQKQVSRYQAKGIRRDGKIIDIEVFGVGIRYKGKPAVQGVVIDITERVQANEKLELYKAIIEEAHDSIAIIDPDGFYLEQNRAHAEMLGYSDDELHGKTPAIHFGEEAFTEIATELAKDGVFNRELQSTTKSGDTLHLDLSSFGIKDSLGQILCYVGIKRDITEQVQVEKSLRESEKKFRDLFEKSEDALLIIENGKFADCNQATVRMLRYKDKNEILNTYPSVLSPEKQPDGRDSLEKANEMIAIAFEKGSHRFIWEHRRADGEIFPVEILLTAITDDDEEQTLHTTWRDISERVLSEKALQQSNELLAQERKMFIGGAVVTFKWQNKEGWPVEYLSPNVYIVLGYTAEQFMSGEISYADIIKSEDIERVASEVTESEESGVERLVHEPYRIVKKGGEIIWVTDYTTILRDKSGETTHYLGYILDITERINSETALRESEEKYRLLLNNQNDAIFVHPMKPEGFGGFLDVNDMACERYGYTRDELLHLSPHEISDPEDAKRRGSHTGRQELRKNGKAVFEAKHITKEGKKFSVEISSTIIELKGKKAILSVARDITERIESETALRESEKKHRDIFENAMEGMFQTTIEGRFLSVNPAVAKIYGYESPEEIMAQITDIREQMYVDGSERDNLLNTLNDNQDIAIAIERNYRKDGSMILVSTKSHLIRDKKGKALYIEGFIEDVTERVNVEKSLRESEAFLRQSQEVARLGSYDMDVVKGIWNSSLVLNILFGIDDEYPRDVEGWLGIIHPDDREMLQNYFTEDVVSQRKRLDKEYRIIRMNDKESRWVHSLGELKYDDQSNPSRIVGTIQDITERIQAEEALQQYTQQLETLNTITSALSASLNLEDLLEIILEEVGRVIQFDSSAIFLLEDDNGQVTIAKAVGEAAKFTGRSIPHDEILMRNIVDKEALILDDASQSPDYAKWEGQSPIRGWMGLPLFARDTLLGYLTFDSSLPQAFTAEHAALAESFTPQIAQALYNARLHERVIADANEMEKRVRARTDELQRFVNLTAGREIRMAELKKVVRDLRTQIENAGMNPVADDPLEKR